MRAVDRLQRVRRIAQQQRAGERAGGRFAFFRFERSAEHLDAIWGERLPPDTPLPVILHPLESGAFGSPLFAEVIEATDAADWADETNTLVRSAVACTMDPDRALRAGELGEDRVAPAQDEEFVMSHSDSVEATGFVEHLKLPHYVDFQAELELVRRMRAEAEGEQAGPGEAAE